MDPSTPLSTPSQDIMPLPTEIIEQVMEKANDGVLIRMAICSRSFYEMTIRSLYSRPTLRTKSNLSRFVQRLETNPSRALLVKELKFLLRSRHEISESSIRDMETIVARSTNLTSLTLPSYNLDRNVRTRHNILRFFPEIPGRNLKSLWIRSYDIPLPTLLDLLPSLVWLRRDNVYLFGNEIHPPNVVHTALKYLHLEGSTDATEFRWIMQNCLNLQNLYFSPHHILWRENVEEAFQLAPESLTTISVFDYNKYSPPPVENLESVLKVLPQVRAFSTDDRLLNTDFLERFGKQFEKLSILFTLRASDYKESKGINVLFSALIRADTVLPRLRRLEVLDSSKSWNRSNRMALRKICAIHDIEITSLIPGTKNPEEYSVVYDPS